VRTGRTLERKSEVNAYLAGLRPDALCRVYASRLDDKLWALAKRARLRAPPAQPPDQLAQSLARLDQLSFGPPHPGTHAESNSTSSLQDKTIASDNKPTPAETRDISCEVGLADTEPELRGATGFRRSSGGSLRPASPSEETPPPILETGEDLILESVASPPAAIDPCLSGFILEPGRPESDPVAAVPDGGGQEGGTGQPSEERVKQPTSDGRVVNPRGDEANTCADGPLSEKLFTDVGSKPAASEGNKIEPEPDHADLQVDSAEASQMVTAEAPQMVTADVPQMDTAEAPQMVTAEAPQMDTAEAPQTDTADVPQTDTVVATDAAPTAEAGAPQVNSVEAAPAACTSSGYPRKEPPAAVGGGRRVLNLKAAL
jgi:hypothetical protein